MGCGESKHDVAAGNTISLSDTSKADEPKEIKKDADTTPEAAGTTSEGANTNSASLPKQKRRGKRGELGLGRRGTVGRPALFACLLKRYKSVCCYCSFMGELKVARVPLTSIKYSGGYASFHPGPSWKKAERQGR
ncbi:hypothetical protein NL676_029878 [Syzygium grande]|nr:hypothetical protein NL676_029878 [Syzygium grande]